jgi:hypothetical protein
MTPQNNPPSTPFILRLGFRSVTGITPRKRGTKATPKPQKKTKQPDTSKNEGGFKKRSRNKLIKAINDLTIQPELLVTLTYTDNVSEHPETWKRHLDNLRREMSRKHPQCWWVWRIEPQDQTGKPHYHLVGSLKDNTSSDDFLNWLHTTWCRVVGVDPKEAQYATTVKTISTDMERLSRYMSKKEHENDYHGFREAWLKLTNRWGILGRSHAPVAPMVDYRPSPETLAGAKELILGSIDSQMNSLRDKLAKASSTTSFEDIHKMKQSLTDKQALKNKISHLQDWFGILDADHVEAIRDYLEDRKKVGLL